MVWSYLVPQEILQCVSPVRSAAAVQLLVKRLHVLISAVVRFFPVRWCSRMLFHARAQRLAFDPVVKLSRLTQSLLL